MSKRGGRRKRIFPEAAAIIEVMALPSVAITGIGVVSPYGVGRDRFDPGG